MGDLRRLLAQPRYPRCPGAAGLPLHRGGPRCFRRPSPRCRIDHRNSRRAGRSSAVLDRLTRPATRIVTITVTEKGYCHEPATGTLNGSTPASNTTPEPNPAPDPPWFPGGSARPPPAGRHPHENLLYGTVTALLCILSRRGAIPGQRGHPRPHPAALHSLPAVHARPRSSPPKPGLRRAARADCQMMGPMPLSLVSSASVRTSRSSPISTASTAAVLCSQPAGIGSDAGFAAGPPLLATNPCWPPPGSIAPPRTAAPGYPSGPPLQ